MRQCSLGEAMTIYEYIFVRVETASDMVFVNEYAREGWRVVAGSGAGGSNDHGRDFNDHWVVMERPLDPQPE